MIYLDLFLAFLQIGAFSFGGGYAAMPLIKEQVIERFHWMSEADFTNLISISQMTPGPIAVNGATFVGSQVAGVGGAVCATLGCILPSCLFVTFLAWLYTKYRSMALLQGTLSFLRPAVVAMILAAGLDILLPALFEGGILSFALETVQVRIAIWFFLALYLLRKLKWDPILVMVLCGLAELVCTAFTKTLA